jgi:hypothetical protein
MKARFQLLGFSEKRWHAKVAKAAADCISECVQCVDRELVGMLAAEFHPGTPQMVEVRHDSERQITTIVFATAHWETMPASIEDATEQLASVLIAIAPRPDRDSLAATFHGAGVGHARSVVRVGVRAVADPRWHLVLQFGNSRITIDELHRLYDELDSALQDCGAGEVNGSGVGIGGMHLDLSLTDKDAGLRVVRTFVSEQGFKGEVRLLDSRSGRDLDFTSSNA